MYHVILMEDGEVLHEADCNAALIAVGNDLGGDRYSSAVLQGGQPVDMAMLAYAVLDKLPRDIVDDVLGLWLSEHMADGNEDNKPD